MNQRTDNQVDAASRADTLYAGRTTIDNVLESVELLRGARRADPYEVQWRLSRAYFFLGQEAADGSEKAAHHHHGTHAGRLAARVTPDRVEGQFWLGVNLSLQAAIATPWRAAALALHAKRTLARAVKLDPSYHGAGPHRVLARLLHRMPTVLGGGLEPARKNYEVAVRLDPSNTVTRIYFADLLRALGEDELVREQLQAVLDAAPDPAWEYEQQRDREIARAAISLTAGPQTDAATTQPR
jgi:tetratricopeptide (TPR) repeat protein